MGSREGRWRQTTDNKRLLGGSSSFLYFQQVLAPSLFIVRVFFWSGSLPLLIFLPLLLKRFYYSLTHWGEYQVCGILIILFRQHSFLIWDLRIVTWNIGCVSQPHSQFIRASELATLFLDSLPLYLNSALLKYLKLSRDCSTVKKSIFLIISHHYVIFN